MSRGGLAGLGKSGSCDICISMEGRPPQASALRYFSHAQLSAVQGMAVHARTACCASFMLLIASENTHHSPIQACESFIKDCIAVQGDHGSGSALQEPGFQSPQFPRPEICPFTSSSQDFRGRPSSRGKGSTSARQKVRQGEVLHFRMRDAQAACSPLLYRLLAI